MFQTIIRYIRYIFYYKEEMETDRMLKDMQNVIDEEERIHEIPLYFNYITKIRYI